MYFPHSPVVQKFVIFIILFKNLIYNDTINMIMLCTSFSSFELFFQEKFP